MNIPADSELVLYLYVAVAVIGLLVAYLGRQWLRSRPKHPALEAITLGLAQNDNLLQHCFQTSVWRHPLFRSACLRGTPHPTWCFTPRFLLRRDTDTTTLNFTLTVAERTHLCVALDITDTGVYKACYWLDENREWRELDVHAVSGTYTEGSIKVHSCFQQQVQALESRLARFGINKR